MMGNIQLLESIGERPAPAVLCCAVLFFADLPLRRSWVWERSRALWPPKVRAEKACLIFVLTLSEAQSSATSLPWENGAESVNRELCLV